MMTDCISHEPRLSKKILDEGDTFFAPGNAGKILVIGAVEVIDRRPRRRILERAS
jgi:hypothetical protein